jgi:hypothetical protein
MYSVEAAKTNLEMVKGDDWYLDIGFETSAGVAVDITDWTVWLTLKRVQEDTDANAAYQQKVTAHVDAVNGLSRVSIPAASSTLLLGKYYFDVQVKTDESPTPGIYTMIIGSFNVLQDITRGTT